MTIPCVVYSKIWRERVNSKRFFHWALPAVYATAPARRRRCAALQPQVQRCCCCKSLLGGASPILVLVWFRYALHQWEEHAWDLGGNRYPFYDWPVLP